MASGGLARGRFTPRHTLDRYGAILLEHISIQFAAIVILGIGAQWLAWWLRLPSILLLLLFGFIAGPITGFLDPGKLLGDTLLPLVSISVAIILFEGGLTLNTVDLTHIRRALLNLITIGVLVTWFVAAGAAYYIVGLALPLALLLGAILTVSGPTVVLPLLRHVQPVGHINSLLRWEGIVVDPVGATLAVIVFEAVTAKQSDASNYLVAVAVLKTIAIGGALGYLAARLVTLLLNHHWIPDFLQNPVTLMLVVATHTVSNRLQEESGLLAVTLMGIVLANQKIVSVKHIIEFKENLRVVLLSSLFILLAARLEFSQLTNLGVREGIFVFVLIFIGRPLAVLLSTLRSRLHWRERVFLAWMAPRGIVAAAVTSVFALQMKSEGFAQAEELVPLTFLVIVATVVIYGLTAKPISRWLQVAKPESTGFLIVGGHSWAREIAVALRREGCPVLLVDTNRDNINRARMAGLPAAYASVLSPEIDEEIDLSGLGRMLALTSNDEVNSLATLHFVEHFSRKEVYQLPVRKNGDKDSVSRHLRGRILFGEDLTYKELAARFVAGAAVKQTALTQEFTYEDFRRHHGSDVIPLFIKSERGETLVVTADAKVAPVAGQSIIALVSAADRAALGSQTDESAKADPDAFH